MIQVDIDDVIIVTQAPADSFHSLNPLGPEPGLPAFGAVTQDIVIHVLPGHQEQGNEQHGPGAGGLDRLGHLATDLRRTRSLAILHAEVSGGEPLKLGLS